MDIYEALYTTRAMRRLKPDPIPLDAQARILDAARHAPTIGEGWRFVLVDDPALKAQLAPLYRQAFDRLMRQSGGPPPDALREAEGALGRMVRSGLHLRDHFAEVPLLLFGFGRTRDGSGIYPALWSAMLAARAEGIGATLTGMLQSFYAAEVFELLGAPPDAGWYLNGTVALGYPLGRWGVGARQPVQAVAARNRWDGDLGFAVTESLWPGEPRPTE